MSRLACLVLLVLTACPGEKQTADSRSEASGPCGPGTCGGCCQGNTCLAGNAAEACGGGGLPCVLCQGGDGCSQGQCLPQNGKCNPTNCAQGCCQGDTCAAGTAAELCGTGGLPCVACASSQKCDGQSCGCVPGTCSGCCDNGVCRSGTEDKACGKGGGTCAVCTSAQWCSGGSCKGGSSCTPTSCKGCCSVGQCKAGTDKTACGVNGVTCDVCGAAETCTSGVCNDVASCSSSSCSNGCCQGSKCLSGSSSSACGKSGAACKICGAAQTCQSNACKADPSGIWGITVVSADLDSSKTWDWPFYVEPDPYVEISVGTQTGKTTTKSNTYTPQWNELVLSTTAAAIAANNILIKVQDSEPVGSELIGSCYAVIPENVLLSGSGILTKCGTEGWIKKLELKFTP